jgi:L-fuconolactonase
MATEPIGIVDTHCHLWNIELARKWMAPEWGVLFQTYDSKRLAEVSRSAGVTTCVVIECGTTDEENQALTREAAATDLVQAFAPFIDLESPTLDKELDQWQRNPKCKSVRMRFEGHPDPDILKRPGVLDGLRNVARRGLIFDYLVRTHHLKDVLAVHDKIPNLKCIIEHMAKPDFKERKDRQPWLDCMQRIGRNTGIHCKLSLSPQGEQAADLLKNPRPGWPVEAIKPCVRHLLENFPRDRLMWGSDWPISLLTSDYEGTYRAMREAIGPLNEAEEKQLYRANALRFYGIK